MIGGALARLGDYFDVRYRDNPLPATGDELRSGTLACDALLCLLHDKIDARFLAGSPDLKAVANVAVGYDNIDVVEATKRGILVLNTPGVLTDATADLAFALLLAAARRVAEGDRYVRAGRWQGWTAELLLGRELKGKTLGIIGMGRIGEAVARRARAFGLKIIYTRQGHQHSDGRLEEAYGASRVSLGDLLLRSDFISIHCPLSIATRHLIGKAELERMKCDCIIVNTSRGPVIDQESLIEALQSGGIGAAALDVFEGEPAVPEALLKMENVVLAPHIGSATVETRSAMCAMAVEGLIELFSGTLADNVVNKEVWSVSALRRR
jgi:glyoxylate reductase